MVRQWVLAGLAMVGLAGLSGCFSSVRHVQKVSALAPGTYKTADVGTLEKLLSDRDGAISTLDASVLITASTGGAATGKVKTYTSFRGYIFVQKPRDLRVLLQLPFVGSKALDMVSDGKTFTLFYTTAHGSRWLTGSNEVTKPSKNGLENLRPAVFLDSLLVPGVSDGEYVTLTESTRTLEPVRGRKDAVAEPDYDLAVMKVQSGNMLRIVRTVRFSRTDLLPVEQDVYDTEGRVVTQALYENYEMSGPETFPKMVTIRRPQDQYELKIQVTKLALNRTFDSDQFELKVPAGVKVEQMP